MKLKQDHMVRMLDLYKTHRFEICGMISCTPDGEPASMYECVNVAAKPAKMYSISGIQQMQVFKKMRAKRERLQAIYHSHPSAAPIPSAEDVEKAFYPDAVYIIIGQDPANMPHIRAYSIDPPTWHEVPIEIIDIVT